MNDDFINGIFAGALVLCFFMVAAPKEHQCAVKIVQGTTTQISVGHWVD